MGINMKIGISGFGRIGRQVFESSLKGADIDVSFIYDPLLSRYSYNYLLKSELKQDLNNFKFKTNCSKK